MGFTNDKRWHSLAFACAAGVALAGCTRSGSDAETAGAQAQAVRRFEQFQSAAGNGAVLAVGSAGGAILTSADGGANWRRHALPGPASILGMAACPDGTLLGLDFYRKLWVADADASTWEARAIETSINPLAIACDTANRIRIVGSYSTILSSADRGHTWQTVTLGDDAILSTVQFVDAAHGFVAGEFGLFAATADGGATWQRGPDLADNFYPYALAFRDTHEGWLSGLGGVFMHTRDGGATWQRSATPGGMPIYALVEVGTRLVALGGGGEIAVLHGQDWRRVDHGQDVPTYFAAGTALGTDALLATGGAGAVRVIALPVATIGTAAVTHIGSE